MARSSPPTSNEPGWGAWIPVRAALSTPHWLPPPPCGWYGVPASAAGAASLASTKRHAIGCAAARCQPRTSYPCHPSLPAGLPSAAAAAQPPSQQPHKSRANPRARAPVPPPPPDSQPQVPDLAISVAARGRAATIFVCLPLTPFTSIGGRAPGSTPEPASEPRTPQTQVASAPTYGHAGKTKGGRNTRPPTAHPTLPHARPPCAYARNNPCQGGGGV
jgi:hypothetical protein